MKGAAWFWVDTALIVALFTLAGAFLTYVYPGLAQWWGERRRREHERCPRCGRCPACGSFPEVRN